MSTDVSLDETAHTGGGKMETCHGQDVSDFPLAQCGTQHLELLDDIANVFGIFIDRFMDLEQTIIVSSGSFDPTGNGVRLQQEGSAGSSRWNWSLEQSFASRQ